MLFINPFFFVIYSVPQDKFPIHSSTSHKLKFWHSYHWCYHIIYLLLWKFTVVFTKLFLTILILFIKRFLKISFQVPHNYATIFLSTIQNLIYSIPSKTVNLCTKTVLKNLILIIRLICFDKGTLLIFPSSYYSITCTYN